MSAIAQFIVTVDMTSTMEHATYPDATYTLSHKLSRIGQHSYWPCTMLVCRAMNAACVHGVTDTVPGLELPGKFAGVRPPSANF